MQRDEPRRVDPVRLGRWLLTVLGMAGGLAVSIYAMVEGLEAIDAVGSALFCIAFAATFRLSDRPMRYELRASEAFGLLAIAEGSRFLGLTTATLAFLGLASVSLIRSVRAFAAEPA